MDAMKEKDEVDGRKRRLCFLVSLPRAGFLASSYLPELPHDWVRQGD